MEPKYTEKDSRGHLLVACCECQRGGNGDASCASGMNSKKWDYKSCFMGQLLGKYDADKVKG